VINFSLFNKQIKKKHNTKIDYEEMGAVAGSFFLFNSDVANSLSSSTMTFF